MTQIQNSHLSVCVSRKIIYKKHLIAVVLFITFLTGIFEVKILYAIGPFLKLFVTRNWFKNRWHTWGDTVGSVSRPFLTLRTTRFSKTFDRVDDSLKLRKFDICDKRVYRPCDYNSNSSNMQTKRGYHQSCTRFCRAPGKINFLELLLLRLGLVFKRKICLIIHKHL